MSLFDDIKDSAEGRDLSTRWYRAKVAALGGTSMTAETHIDDGLATAKPNYGMMNLFSYQPSKPEKIPYYDIFPLSIPVVKHRDGFTGINFHYLTIPMRVKLLDILVEAFGENNKVQMSWRQISGLRLARPIVRRYKAKWVKSKFLRLPVEDMLIAAVLPVQQFYSGRWDQKRPVSSKSVWSQTRNKL